MSFAFDAREPDTAPTPAARAIAQRYVAQGGLCAICGKPIAPVGRLGAGNGSSLDHVFPRCRDLLRGRQRSFGLGRWGGNIGWTVCAHRRCNGRKMHRYPTGCEIIWLYAVNARLGLDRPTTRWKSPRLSREGLS